jgi:LPS O-antigen subunit length determinant protein (WzzB/FepE family)
LEKIRCLSGVSFRWNDEALQRFTEDIEHTVCAGPNATEAANREVQQRERDRRFAQLTKAQAGVIAQEVEAVLPEAVTTGDDGYKSVNYNQLIALLIEAIKEQDKAVSAQAALAAQQQIEIEQLKQSLRIANAAGAGKH